MNDTTFQGNGKITYVPVVVNAKPPKQTNADRIRAMTDEELAEWLSRHLAVRQEYENNRKRTTAWLDWLKQEVID